MPIVKSLYEIVNEYLAGRVRTRVYGIFLLWIALFHVHIFFTSLFVSQELIFEKYKLLKGEYIRENLVQIDNLWFWAYEVFALIASALLTWLMIWILPKTLLKHAYARESEDEYGRREVKLQKELALQQLRGEVAKARLDEITKDEKVASKVEELEAKEIDEWGEQYKKLTQMKIYAYFTEIIKAIAEYKGKTRSYRYNGSLEFEMNSDLKTYAYANDLLEFTDGDKNSFDLTPKGKYFITLYQQDNK